MLLSTSRHTLACLLTGCVLIIPSSAFADAKQCVQQNNQGAELRDNHHLLAARDAYRACVAESECPAMVRSECDAALTDIKTAIPTLMVAVLDEQGHDFPGATLSVDGRNVPIDGSSLEVDPGPHELIANSGSLTSHLQVMAIESDVNRRIELSLQRPKPVVLAPAPVPQVHRSKVPVFVLGGVAALGVASFSYFALSGHADLGRLDHSCKPYCEPDDVKRVRTKYLVADVSLGVSLVALAGAGYWLLSSPKEAPRAENKPFSLALSAAPGAAGLSLRWIE